MSFANRILYYSGYTSVKAYLSQLGDPGTFHRVINPISNLSIAGGRHKLSRKRVNDPV
jgi:hypothetical protein